MAKKDEDFLEFVLDQLSGLRRVTSKRMFGGVGLYCDDEFFALLDEGRLYFYVDETTRPRYEAKGMRAFEYAPGKVMNAYWEIPIDVLEDDVALCEWAREAVAAHKKKPARKRRPKKARMLPVALFWLVFTANEAVADQFDSWWHDGKAEMDGYRLVVSRYGENRTGTAVMIFVTEPFSKSKHVKVNDHRANPSDTFDALKLNLVRDFQTGIYDYNTMVSVFVRSENLEPAKITFTSAEWCGHVYGELIFGAKDIRGSYASYFEGESGPVTLSRPNGGITEDELFIAIRGLRSDFLAAGAARTVPYLPGSFYSRLSHDKMEWTQATISRAKASQTVTVPAGQFSTIVYDVRVADGRKGAFHIEAEYPHRIIKWSLPPDVSGELTGSKRLEYWKLNSEGDEKNLEGLGLTAPGQKQTPTAVRK